MTKKQTKKKVAKKRSDKPRRKFKDTEHTCVLLDALEAPDDIDSLKEEMEEWRDNLENGNLGSTQKFEDVSQAADELESLRSEIDDSVDELKRALQEAGLDDLLRKEIKFIDRRPYGRSPARWLRLENACASLHAALAVLEREVPESEKELHAQISNVAAALDAASSVSFPEMY